MPHQGGIRQHLYSSTTPTALISTALNTRHRGIPATTTGITTTNNSHAHATVRQVLYSFCRWTSLRGMPHVVRSEHTILSVLWGLFVIIMFAFNIGLVCLLLDRYYRFNTIENIKTERNTKVPFPAVTVCNVDPVNTDRILCLRKHKENDTCAEIDKNFTFILDAYRQSNEYMAHNYSVVSDMEDPSKISVFYQLIGVEAASLISHQLDDFVVPEFCNVSYVDKGGNLVRLPCSAANVSKVNFIHYKHFNCYTMTIENTSISQSANRMSISLYLDEEEDFSCRPYCTHEFTEWSGAKVVIHRPNTLPLIEKRGMNLFPGASSQVLIQEVRLMENKNVGNNFCEQDSDKHLSIYQLNNQSRSLLYTAELCMELSYQLETINKCNCIDSALVIPAGIDIKNLPFCGNMSRANVSEQLKCKRKIRMDLSQKVIQNCTLPCQTMDYYVELTQLRWPQKPHILNLYKHLTNRVYFERKFRIYKDIDELSKTNTSEAMRRLRDMHTFENNFLQLDINRPSVDSLVRYQVNEEYTLPTLLSQIGGICSIFLGATFVTIIELIELFYRLSLSLWYSCKQQKSRSDEYADEQQQHLSSSLPPLTDLNLGHAYKLCDQVDHYGVLPHSLFHHDELLASSLTNDDRPGHGAASRHGTAQEFALCPDNNMDLSPDF